MSNALNNLDNKKLDVLIQEFKSYNGVGATYIDNMVLSNSDDVYKIIEAKNPSMEQKQELSSLCKQRAEQINKWLDAQDASNETINEYYKPVLQQSANFMWLYYVLNEN